MVKLLLPIFMLLSVGIAQAEQGVINGNILDDPTGPWGAVEPVIRRQAKAKVPIPTLQAIFMRDQTYIAIMNDKEVQAGSWVSGFKVRRVTTDFVYFVRNDKEFRLSLFGSEIKH
ncbi:MULTISPECIES: MSHA biogenesis protein MshK [unclassified Moritella]|uniref:MSHA biogenesis protein MshK n=1 Tax=unclassified Moritella TaxID=2637987 RepID=UPI001BA7E536|nr:MULTISPECIES: MSHA biogenesis protein MshK [unclassified Moritella]QUM79002.1 MSHA biogenesis protein MshK [Moritella sp. 5]QUM83204.1 MSHA biogenesis protein MshK [Moritella sp. 28]QUM87505.1 MSHA biogenesis protein MshK [Moritella sp. 36]